MIPQNNSGLENVENKEQPSKTFRINEKNVIKGTCDNVEALKQAIFLMLSVERYTCPLVSFNYGAEFSDLIGKPLSYCIPETEYRIRDALMQDDRINSVDDFNFEVLQKRTLLVTFKVDSTLGTFEMEKEVSI